MCCFSRPVQEVSRTSIFARHTRPGWQALVYSMSVRAKEPVAMVLPLPVLPGSGEGGLRFVDFSAHGELFEQLERLFPKPAAVRSRSIEQDSMAPANVLKVHTVGSFVASYAPTRADMARLDPQFRLPEAAWKALPKAYEKYGYAVFQLRAGEEKFHPMAMEFQTAVKDTLFFPTAHVHDGKVHESAHFDHTLYCQAPVQPVGGGETWWKSAGNVETVVELDKTNGLLGKGVCFKQRLYGNRPNEDTLARATA